MLFPMQRAMGMGGVSTPGLFAATGPARSERKAQNIFGLGLNAPFRVRALRFSARNACAMIPVHTVLLIVVRRRNLTLPPWHLTASMDIHHSTHKLRGTGGVGLESLGPPGNEVGHFRPGKGVSADFAEITRCNEARQRVPGSPPRRCLDGTPELTEARRLRATAAEGIPEGFRGVPIALPDAMGHQPGRVAPGGAEARSPFPARNESGRYRNQLEVLKSQTFTAYEIIAVPLLPFLLPRRTQ